MSDQQILYRLRGDSDSMEAAAGRAEAALAAVERTLGDLAGQLGRTAAASTAFERTQASSAQALRSVAEWERTLANIRAAGQTAERQRYATQQQFLQGLEQQAAQLGRTRSELLAMQAAELGVSAQAAPLISRLAAAEKGAGGLAKTGKLTAFEMQQLGFQLNDLGVQVLSGQNPLTALVQQGSQLTGTFGGVGGALRAVGTVLTPAVLGFTALSAVVGVYAYAAYTGLEQTRAFDTAIALTGNAAGVTAGQMDRLAASVAANAKVSAGSARDIVQALVASGQAGPQVLASMAQAAGRLQRLTHAGTEEIVKDLTAMSQGVARWAAEKNRAMNFITAEQYAYIRSLEAQGHAEEAALVATNALNTALKDREPQLGTLARLWKEAKEGVSGYFDRLAAAGRANTVDEALTRTTNELAQLQRKLERNRPLEATREGGIVARQLKAQIADKQAEIAALRQSQQLAEQVARATADHNKEEQRKILESGDSFVAAKLGKEAAGYAQSEALAAVAREKRLAETERLYTQLQISGEAYRARKDALDREAAAAEVRQVDQQIALEQRRLQAAGSPEQRLAGEQRLLELGARRIQLLGQQARLEEQIRQGKNAGAPREVQESPQAAFRRAELEQTAAVEQGLAQRRQATLAHASQLLEGNRALNIALLQDDRARGEAQIALEEEQLRKQLELALLSADDRKRVENDLATWRALREQQLTEELKPQYQRNLDAWRDTTRMMREASDEFHQSFQDAGRDAFREWAATGRASAEGLGRAITDTLADITYQRFIAGPLDNLASTIFSGLQSIGASAGTNTAQESFRASEIAAQNAAEAVIDQTLATATQTAAQQSATSSTLALASAASAAAAALHAVAGGNAGEGLASLFGGAGGSGGVDYGTTDYAANPFAAYGFAKGGAFTNRVVTEPTLFRFAKGGKLGEMGEAGPEAIVPLARGPGGELGVRNFGGGGGEPVAPIINVYNQAPGVKVETKARQDERGGWTIDQVVTSVEQRLANKIDQGTGLTDAFARRFGLNPGNGTPQRGRG